MMQWRRSRAGQRAGRTVHRIALVRSRRNAGARRGEPASERLPNLIAEQGGGSVVPDQCHNCVTAAIQYDGTAHTLH